MRTVVDAGKYDVSLLNVDKSLDEFFEIITLKKLHIHNKPIVIFNMNHFYDSMLEMIEFMIKENTIPEDNRNLFKVCYTIEETLDYIESHDESE